MKYQKNLILFIISIVVCITSFSFSQSISLDVNGIGVFGNGCLVPVDVYVDTKGQEISAMDLMMETNMIYKDFVPNTFFPYYLPPVVRDNGLIHIVGFTVNPNERVNSAGKIGTIYFEQKSGYVDGTIKIYFSGKGQTTDSNLSKAGGVDVLDDVGDLNIAFSGYLASCYNNSIDISGGFAGMTYQDGLKSTLQKIYDNYGRIGFWMFLQNNIFFVIILFLLLVVVLALIYHKKILYYFNKNTVGRKYMQ